ncbi:hypothetical protein [Chroococcidiopsis sp.]|uniref:hypothetical protein n=1 Tax=Chroococcidiopsis sp. TaxID=3088168 RepID=UPI003F30A952
MANLACRQLKCPNLSALCYILRIGEFVLILEEVDVIRQDLAETVFSHTHAGAISDRQNLQEQFPSDEIQLDENGSNAGAATVIQLPSIFPEAAEIPLSDRQFG